MIKRPFSKIFLSLWAISAHAQVENGLHLDWMDQNISPRENFFLYANGMWQKNNPIPSHYASWGSFSVLIEKIETLMHQLVLDASKDQHAKRGSLIQKVGDFYESGMDKMGIQRAGLNPLKPILNQIRALNKWDDFPQVVASLHLLGVHVLFDFGAMQDFKNSQKMIAGMAQDGLSLPDRDYYLSEGESFKEARQAFLVYVKTLLMLSGEREHVASESAETILKIETALAQASKTQAELRDPEKTYHLMSLSDLHQLTPHFSWPTYLRSLDLSRVSEINVETPDFMRYVDKMLLQFPVEAWRAYFQFHVLSTFSDDLTPDFEKASFKMLQTLKGVKTLPPRWKRVLREESNSLGFAMGELYVKRYAKESVKREVSDMTENIYKVFQDELKTLYWMSPKTREAALKKLLLMKKRIGYPKTWWDYSSLDIVKGPYVLNVMRGNTYLVRRNLQKIGHPIDENEWYMTPQMVNAYYDTSMNHITIPMGILASPFYDENASVAVNYGGIGAVIGHEMTHGFDDQGAKFDAYGNLKNWWTSEDLKQFQDATACVSKQFSSYQVSGLSLRGPLVVGEATADLGGLKLAYLAFKQSKAYQKAQTISGFTPDQQFFIGFAHIWANNTRPEQSKLWAITDPHPPAMYRVNGSLINMDAFRRAFNIKSEAGHCQVW
jgi:putative endopeptidase